MEFETFKKHIDRILLTREKEDKLSDCIEENLSSSTYCIVDIAGDVCTSVEELLADHYDCYYEIQGVKDNDISWWLYTEKEHRKIHIKEKGKREKIIDLSTIEKLWEYLEENLNRKKAEKNNENSNKNKTKNNTK